jgi:hypothetical protein
MMAAISVLFGALLAIATCWALGAILLRWLSLHLFRTEEPFVGFIVGSACLSAVVFLLAALHLAYKGVFLAVAASAIVAAFALGAHRPIGDNFSPLPALWKWTFIAVFGAFTVLYFFNAMAPEMSPDGMTYHLGEVAKYYRAHGFVRITTNLYGNLSQGIELLFFFAFAYGKHSAAALVHYAFLVSLTFLMLCYGRRIGHPAVGVTGALFFYVSPVVGQDGTVAYNDVAIAAILFAVFYLLQIWDQDRNILWLAPIGILAGFSFAAKYTAFLAVPYAIGFVVWKLWRARKPMLRPVAIVSALALVFILPWLIKNALWVDNPVSPFANRLFPNPYVHVSFEEGYIAGEQSYGLKNRSEIPLQVTIKGDVLHGFLGPLFLLVPLALLALRFRAGRGLLLVGLVFALPYAGNIGTRFLIPPAPFFSVALALAFADFGWILLPLVLAHAISCWPSVARLYCEPSAWRLAEIPVKAALRIEPEADFLSRHTPQYDEARMIDRIVPPGEKVFSFSQVAEAYASREVLVSYQAASNEVLRDMLLTALFKDYQPTRMLTFRFGDHELRAIRVVETASARDSMWSIAELRVFQAGQELAREPGWRLRARPNPWDVQLAFDNNPATRWRSWQTAEPGMFVELDFGQTQRADSVVVESADEGHQTRINLEGLDARGTWSTLSQQPSETIRRERMELRRFATMELKARGIHYLLVGKGDIRPEDFELYPRLWGLRLAGRAGDTRLYSID